MSFNVLLTESISAQGIDLLKKRAEVRITPSPLLTDLMPLIADAEVPGRMQKCSGTPDSLRLTRERSIFQERIGGEIGT